MSLAFGTTLGAYEVRSLLTAVGVGELCRASLVLGTVGHISLEKMRGQAADQRSGIFSFRVILYEMLFGKPAFKGGSGVETIHAILKEDPLELADGEIRIGGFKDSAVTAME